MGKGVSVSSKELGFNCWLPERRGQMIGRRCPSCFTYMTKHLIELQAERQQRIDLALRNGYRPGFTRDGRVCLVKRSGIIEEEN